MFSRRVRRWQPPGSGRHESASIENSSTPGATIGMYAAIQRAVFTRVTTWVDPCDSSAAENGGDCLTLGTVVPGAGRRARRSVSRWIVPPTIMRTRIHGKQCNRHVSTGLRRICELALCKVSIGGKIGLEGLWVTLLRPQGGDMSTPVRYQRLASRGLTFSTVCSRRPGGSPPRGRRRTRSGHRASGDRPSPPAPLPRWHWYLHIISPESDSRQALRSLR
jgi:hypothetical protein